MFVDVNKDLLKRLLISILNKKDGWKKLDVGIRCLKLEECSPSQWAFFLVAQCILHERDIAFTFNTRLVVFDVIG